VSAEDVPEVVVRAGNILIERGFQGMLDAYEELFTEDFEWSSAILRTFEAGVYKGHAGLENYWREFSESFGSMSWSDPTYDSVGPNRALCTARVHMEGTGSGIPMIMEPAYVFDVRDGLISWASNFMSLSDAEEFLANA
jgi:hypothetical protein